MLTMIAVERSLNKLNPLNKKKHVCNGTKKNTTATCSTTQCIGKLLIVFLSVKRDMNSGHLITGLNALIWPNQDANIVDFESLQRQCTNTHFVVTEASLFSFIAHQSLDIILTRCSTTRVFHCWTIQKSEHYRNSHFHSKIGWIFV